MILDMMQDTNKRRQPNVYGLARAIRGSKG